MVNLKMDGAANKIGQGRQRLFPFEVVALIQLKAVINLCYGLKPI